MTAPVFLLVHGGFHGAWCWERTIPHLEAAGAAATAVTLTGLGERAAEASAAIDVSTHADDVVAAVDAAATDQPVVVVSHSYSGFPVELALDRLAGRDALGRVAHVVHVDAFVPAGGDAILDYFPPDLAGLVRGSVGDDGHVPGMDPALLGLTEPDDLAWVLPRLTPQSLATMEERVELQHDTTGVPRTYVECLVGADVKPFGLFAARGKDAGWGYRTLDTGHDAMVTDPEGLAAALLASAA